MRETTTTTMKIDDGGRTQTNSLSLIFRICSITLRSLSLSHAEIGSRSLSCARFSQHSRYWQKLTSFPDQKILLFVQIIITFLQQLCTISKLKVHLSLTTLQKLNSILTRFSSSLSSNTDPNQITGPTSKANNPRL